jgi:hypothetical protein
LAATSPNLQSARDRIAEFNDSFCRRVAEEVLLNTLGISLHSAAMRLSGAETSDLSYFYKRGETGLAAVYLFDTDDFGNGTSDLIRETLHVSAVERTLVARQRALGGAPDPLPTTDFADCLEDIFQECDNASAAQLAFHALPANGECFADLAGTCASERHVAGVAMDFVRMRLGISSIDHILPLQACPEFLAHSSRYGCHAGWELVPSSPYPTFQALESAMAFCVDGCVACVVAPEQNLRGVLGARDTVSKLILDAAYRIVVCQSAGSIPSVTYPGTGPGRTELWPDLALRVASALGQSPQGAQELTIELPTSQGATTLTVVQAASAGQWNRVFRPTWSPAGVPQPRVRPRMSL